MIRKKNKTVIGKINVEGYHFYPDAPVEVNFLSNKHRHTFQISFGYQVEDLNREKEIFIERDKVKRFVKTKYLYHENATYFMDRSCEMIANDILEEFEGEGMIFCEVWEEETGGARVEVRNDH